MISISRKSASIFFALALLMEAVACSPANEVPTPSPPAPVTTGKVIVGKVIAIADGDTLTVREGEENYKVRLNGIDCPEAGQDYGSRAKQALGAIVAGETVRIEWTERDRYGRILGDVYLGDRWINRELVSDGWAWHFVRYSDDGRLALAEGQAREAKRGLWADPNRPVAPWDYRHPTPPVASSIVPQEPTPEVARVAEAKAESFWLNTSSNVRHRSSCKYFQNTKKGRKCGPDEGKACGICGG